MRCTQVRHGQVYACQRHRGDSAVPALVVDTRLLWSVRPSLRYGQLGTLDFVPASPEAQISDPESFSRLTVATDAVTGLLAVKTAPRAAILQGHRRVDLDAALAAMRLLHTPKHVDVEVLLDLRNSLPPYLTTTVVSPVHLLAPWNDHLHRMRGERKVQTVATLAA